MFLLASRDLHRLTFSRTVSRANPKSNDKHVILGVIGRKPRDFANQTNLSLSSGRRIARTNVDMALWHGGGDLKFVLVKDSNKTISRLYQAPTGSFEDDGETEGEVVEETEETEEVED